MNWPTTTDTASIDFKLEQVEPDDASLHIAALEPMLADFLRRIVDLRIISIAASNPRKGTSHEVPDLLSHNFYRTIQIDGLSIFYREAGPKNVPTLLLLHGTAVLITDVRASLCPAF